MLIVGAGDILPALPPFVIFGEEEELSASISRQRVGIFSGLQFTDEDFKTDSELNQVSVELGEPLLCIFDCNLFELLTEGEVDELHWGARFWTVGCLASIF
jgi:hypothetical protein